MKRRLLLSFICLCLIGCVGENRGRLSDSEQSEIKREVKQVFTEILKNSEAANLEAALKYYADSPDFIGVFGDGTVNDYKIFVKGNREFFNNISSQEFATLRENILVLGRDAAIYTWQARAVMKMKKGGAMSMDPFAATFVFKRIGNEWKVIYSHESSMPPVEVSSDP